MMMAVFSTVTMAPLQTVKLPATGMNPVVEVSTRVWGPHIVMPAFVELEAAGLTPWAEAAAAGTSSFGLV